ncbi:MAG: helix-turn-helix domain-containing protein [Planctomycetota bacterium]
MKTKANRNGKAKTVPLLVDAEGVAGMIGCSKSHIWRLRDSGKLPLPVKVGSLVRWRVEDIAAWLRDRCPNVDGRNSA